MALGQDEGELTEKTLTATSRFSGTPASQVLVASAIA